MTSISKTLATEMRRLVKGYRHFHKEYYDNPQNQLFKDLAQNGQRPKIMVISCSDSRVDPSKIFGCKPGELFMVRNVANLVPPYEENPRHHATSAALEFAVTQLKVHHVLILGHSQCGGIRSLLKDKNERLLQNSKSYISQWMKIAEDAKQHVLTHHRHLSAEQKACVCEEQALKISLRNLSTFSWVRQAVDEGRLQLHAWHFNLNCGLLRRFAPTSDTFEVID